MTYRDVAFMGRMGSGKDSAAARLVEQRQYTRVAFADALRTTALDLDPIVGAESSGYGALPIRLSDLVRRYGWDRAKDVYPEVRRTLQRLGQAVREHDPGHWLRLALAKLDTADAWGLPAVVTDCRHVNEAQALRARGVLLVRIVRPAAGGRAGGAAEQQHVSETALDAFPADVTIHNVGTVAELYAAVDALPVLV
ncbi:hypothetical protein [Streptomyces sp. NPDC001404]|uniref:deoxynucleotide monophosphate kinase family protein n=1 Tax=Streptomyces sp. NPDC001404 TaxID=3364571 RepID=UPI0036BA9C4E